MEQVLILGGGIAGLTAALYAARANLSPLVIEGKAAGGQLMLTTTVENYPGFPDGVQGPELMQLMRKQAEKFGTRYKGADATSFDIKDGFFEIGIGEENIQSKTVIIATGAFARMLGLESEAKYMARGVHTCATCDGYFYADKELIVIGGGDSACEESLFLTKLVKKVTIVHRRDTLRASKIMQQKVFDNPKIDIMWNKEIADFTGDGTKVTGVKLKDTQTGELTEKNIDGAFLAIGHIPNTKMFQGKVDLDELGFVITDKHSKTNVPGVFAAGDVQDPIFKQAVTSAGTGCEGAMGAERYLEKGE